ncbi:MAG: RDD family protein [Elusimicrobia bacterium]|nr:RDD family protein [Elusimicrobiota bacterium]
METRNLAIMLTDIKGFTSKTASFSRAQTQELLTRHRELVLPVIEKFGGRLVKTIGDAFLVVFNSPTDAVICGMEIQAVLKAHNAEKAAPDKIEIRIAINAGEVAVHDDGDIYGDPVNITSRLESIAEAGEVFFTEAVYLSMNKREVPSSEIGYRQFKGIPEKIKVFRVLREVPVGSQPPGEAQEPPSHGSPVAPASRPPAVPGAPAPISLRAVSLLLDLVLFMSVASILTRQILFLGAVLSPIKIMIWVFCISFFLKRKGATPGMMIMKLKLVDAATGETPGKTLWRAALGVVSAVPLGLGYIWAFFEKDGLTWHDLLTNTRIVRA